MVKKFFKMEVNMIDIGLKWDDLERYIIEQIYTLPGIDNHEEELSVLLTGSRAINAYSKNSDVDLDVICSKETFEKIQKEMYRKGLTPNINQAFYYLPEKGWEKYFGDDVGRPHFTITSLDVIENQISNYEDVPTWIWTNAVVINDPNDQFKDIVGKFKGYPHEILEKKIKYRYLLASYWLIDGYPHHHKKDEDIFPAMLSILNGIHELYRFFYIVEGKPYPYSEKLSLYVIETKLGSKFKLFIDRIINMVVGIGCERENAWERLDRAIELLLYGDVSPESVEFFDACDEAMIMAGIEEGWVKSGYDNIDELLSGKLGPLP